MPVHGTNMGQVHFGVPIHGTLERLQIQRKGGGRREEEGTKKKKKNRMRGSSRGRGEEAMEKNRRRSQCSRGG